MSEPTMHDEQLVTDYLVGHGREEWPEAKAALHRLVAEVRAECAQAREAAWSEPYRVFCEKHSEHRPVYTDGRPLLDDSCARCRLERAEKERDEARADANDAHRVWKMLAAEVGCSSLTGDAEIGQVQVIKERLEAAEARLREAEEHERQTHEELGAILGTDDSLAQGARRMAARLREVEQEKADYRARFDLIEKAQAARIPQVRELRAALEEVLGWVHQNGWIGRDMSSEAAVWQRAAALLAHTEPPKETKA